MKADDLFRFILWEVREALLEEFPEGLRRLSNPWVMKLIDLPGSWWRREEESTVERLSQYDGGLWTSVGGKKMYSSLVDGCKLLPPPPFRAHMLKKMGPQSALKRKPRWGNQECRRHEQAWIWSYNHNRSARWQTKNCQLEGDPSGCVYYALNCFHIVSLLWGFFP